jgi:hypothetical protein
MLQPYEFVKNQSGWYKENDSSLGDGGFELISPALDLSSFKKSFKEDKYLQYLLSSKKSSRCGGHIHISKEGLTGLDIANKLKGLYLVLGMLYPKRLSNSYCHYLKWREIVEQSTRRETYAYNILINRIEIRLFTSPANHKVLLARLELIYMYLQNDISLEDTVAQLKNRKSDLMMCITKLYENGEKVKVFLSRLESTLNYFN